jgi:hypothetical protein
VELTWPRLTNVAKITKTIPVDTLEEYFLRTVLVPHLHVLVVTFAIAFPEIRFGRFRFVLLTSEKLENQLVCEYLEEAKSHTNMNGNLLRNCLAEARRWYKLSKISTSSIDGSSLDFLYVHSDSFCPWVRDFLWICLYVLWRLAQMKASASPLEDSRHDCCQPPWALNACVLVHHVFTRNQSRK